MAYKILLALPALAALIALLSPYLQIRAAKHDDAIDTTMAQRHLFFSGFILVVTLAAAANLSFAWHAGNVVVVAAALASFGMLALFSFRIRPKFIGIPVGIVSLCVCLLLLLYAAASTLFSGNSPMTVALGDGRYCRETVYGFVTSDSGEELEIYQRYLIIDRSIYYQAHSEVYPNEPVRAPAKLTNAITRCQSEISKQRVAGGAPREDMLTR